jgi:hypothetical protein
MEGNNGVTRLQRRTEMFLQSTKVRKRKFYTAEGK